MTAGNLIALAAMDAMTLGLMEVFLVPMALHEARKNRRTATFTYGPDERLLDHGPPPPYGLADDVVAGLSHGDIRERCRSEHPVERREAETGGSAQPLPFRDHPYQECVVQRLAIWGIE